LPQYLREDLVKLGVNPDDFVFRRVRDVDIWDYIAVPLDMVYNRLFTLTSRNYQDIIDKLEQPRDDTYLRINNSLKRNKDLSFVGGVLLSLVAFWCFLRGRFSTSPVLLGVFSFRVCVVVQPSHLSCSLQYCCLCQT